VTGESGFEIKHPAISTELGVVHAAISSCIAFICSGAWWEPEGPVFVMGRKVFAVSAILGCTVPQPVEGAVW